MSFNLFCLFAITSAVSDKPLRKHRHSSIADLPHTITFHGLHVDLDQLKPPVRETGMDALSKQISTIQEKEHSQLVAEEEAIKKVETEFLNSDLHKEALAIKFRPDE